MSVLDENWKPEFGTIYTWFAQDRFGRIAVMVNNCFGNLPKQLLLLENVEYWLDNINDYMWEVSKKYPEIPDDKQGEFSIDMYSFWRNGSQASKEKIQKRLKEKFEKNGRNSELNVIVNRGFFEYHGVEGSYEGEDYPVGYNGKTKMGDYYRYLVPSIYASILDFPEDLQHVIAVSPMLDFTQDRVLDNSKINEYFPY